MHVLYNNKFDFKITTHNSNNNKNLKLFLVTKIIHHLDGDFLTRFKANREGGSVTNWQQ